MFEILFSTQKIIVIALPWIFKLSGSDLNIRIRKVRISGTFQKQNSENFSRSTIPTWKMFNYIFILFKKWDFKHLCFYSFLLIIDAESVDKTIAHILKCKRGLLTNRWLLLFFVEVVEIVGSFVKMNCSFFWFIIV